MMITEFGGITDFRNFTLKKEEGTHSICEFSAAKREYIADDSIFDKIIKIYDCNSISEQSVDNLLMVGKVSNIKYLEGYNENLIFITITSRSAQLNEKRYTRIFQSTKKTQRDLLENIAENKDYEIAFTEENLGRQIVEEVQIQLEETDMEFLGRIAGQMHTSLWVDDKSQGKYQIRIGGSRGDIVTELNREELLVLDSEISSTEEKIRFRLEQHSRMYHNLELGSRVRLSDKEFVICEFTIKKEKQVYIYEYIAVQKKNLFLTQKNLCENYERKPLYHFTGTVIHNKDEENMGRVQIDFSADNIIDISDNQNIWIDVSTIYDGDAGGVVFIPDEGDLVDVLWNGNIFWVAGTRRKKRIAEEHQNIDEKCIADKYGRKICFSEEFLTIRSGESMILLNNENIKIKQENLNIIIENNRLFIESENSQIEVSDNINLHTKTVHMDTDKNLECNVEKNIIMEGNSIKITSKGNVSVSGKKVAIN